MGEPPAERRWRIEHDWAVLLERWHWLERDQSVGGVVYLVGVLLYATAVIGGWMLLRRSSA